MSRKDPLPSGEQKEVNIKLFLYYRQVGQHGTIFKVFSKLNKIDYLN